MKLVRENINEKFTEDGDPIQDMGIGLIHKIKEWLKEYKNSGRTWVSDAKYKINKDLTIDVIGSVDLYEINLEKLPDYIQFNKVTGSFWINNNKLTTLKGCPIYVGQTFYCCNNKLTSLKYAPKTVKEDFVCFGNNKVFSESYVRKICKVGKKVR